MLTQNAVVESRLPKLRPGSRLPLVSGSLLPGAHGFAQVCFHGGALKEPVQMIGHHAVRDNFEAASDKERSDLRGERPRVRFVRERARSEVRRESNEVAMKSAV